MRMPARQPAKSRSTPFQAETIPSAGFFIPINRYTASSLARLLHHKGVDPLIKTIKINTIKMGGEAV